MNDLLAYQFEEDPVRVVLIDGEVWWVAADVAKVLGYRDAPNMVRNLDDDEAATHIVSSSGQNREMNVISESGMWHAIIKSRLPRAREVRRWVTAEVLPSIRRTGKYELGGHEPPQPAELALNINVASVSVGLNLVREARRLFGPNAARQVWLELGLPQPIVDAVPSIEGDPLAGTVKAFLAGRGPVTRSEVIAAIGLDPNDLRDVHRVNALMRFAGRVSRSMRVAGTKGKFWVPLSSVEG